MNTVNSMNTVNKFRCELDRSSKKATCPQCRQKRLVLYRDIESREYLPDHVGRCDRESSCGYHFTPKQYFTEGGQIDQAKPYIEIIQQPKQETQFLPFNFLEACTNQKYYVRNNFYTFLHSIFTETVTKSLFSKYLIGTSSFWYGAAVFPQIDQAGNLRQLKIMLHNPETGKRIKEGAKVQRLDPESRKYITENTKQSCSMIAGAFIHDEGLNLKHRNGLNLEQTFFGCHLITEHPEKDICIVESEKTAMIASVYLPQFIWLATGGASGCKWREHSVYKALKGRSVTFFPDHGYFNKQKQVTCYTEWKERCERIQEALGPVTKIKVSDILERRLKETDRQDQDLADLLIVRDESTGLALTDNGYPISWDFKSTAQ